MSSLRVVSIPQKRVTAFPHAPLAYADYLANLAVSPKTKYGIPEPCEICPHRYAGRNCYIYERLQDRCLSRAAELYHARVKEVENAA